MPYKEGLMLLFRFLMYLSVPFLPEKRLALLFLPLPLAVYLVVVLRFAHNFVDVQRVQRLYLAQRMIGQEVFGTPVIQPADHFDILVSNMQGILHTLSDIRDSLDIPGYRRVILSIWDQVGLGLYFVEGSGLNCEVWPAALHVVHLVARPGLPWTVNQVIMLFVLLILFLLRFNTRLGNIEMMLAIVARDRECLGLLM